MSQRWPHHHTVLPEELRCAGTRELSDAFGASTTLLRAWGSKRGALGFLKNPAGAPLQTDGPRLKPSMEGGRQLSGHTPHPCLHTQEPTCVHTCVCMQYLHASTQEPTCVNIHAGTASTHTGAHMWMHTCKGNPPHTCTHMFHVNAHMQVHAWHSSYSVASSEDGDINMCITCTQMHLVLKHREL